MNRFAIVTLCLVFLMTVAGCGHDDHDDHSANEEACEHMKEGPNTTLTAGSDADSATDTEHTDWEHKRVDITLVESGGTHVGFVKYEAEAAGDYRFFANNEATIKIAGEAPEATGSVSECDEVKGVDTFELPVGEHVVEISSTKSTIQLVVEMASDEHDDHD